MLGMKREGGLRETRQGVLSHQRATGLDGEGNKTGLRREEPWGTVLKLGVRQMSHLKGICTTACSTGNNQEELEATVRQANYGLIATTVIHGVIISVN